MPKKVTFDVTANTKGAQKGLSDVAKASGVLSGVLGKLGPVGVGIASVLDKLGIKNLDAAAGFGIATAAIGASIKIGEDAINQYVTLGEEIQHYSAVTGQSAEASSRQVEAFKELGVDADVAAAGMFMLGKAVAKHSAVLIADGIQIAKTKDGTVDLNATMLNVIDAWQKQGDAAKRDKIIFDAFGKSGAAMIPILETNAAKLRQLEDTIAKVYTAKDLEAIRQYTIAQKEAKASADEWGLTLGQTLLPAQKAVYDSLNENVFVAKNYDAKLQELTGSSKDSYAAHVLVDRALRAEWAAAQGAAIATDALASSAQNAADAAKAEADAEDTLYNAIEKNRDAHFAYRQALIDLTKAQKDATAAKGKDKEANLRLEEAIANVGDAAVAAAAAQRLANGEAALTTDQSIDVQVAALKKVEKTVKKGSSLYNSIEAYIALLRSIPTSVNTKITGTGGSKPPRLLAAGGSVAPGETVIAGERGAEMVTGGASGATVTPMGRGGGGGASVHLHIHGGMFMDNGPTIDAISNALLRYARHRPGR